jgi:hypothetical protein
MAPTILSLAKLERAPNSWLLPRTRKSAAQSHQVAYTWYEESIISKSQISDSAP